MAWPSDQDYNEAIQNPRIAFADPELQTGQVELNAMGIPKARSGNFATVYKINVNGAAHAVRCFRYDNPEHTIRYPAIASHLTQNALAYMVSFRYMSQGIRVGSSWYPFVRMRWVDGDSLVSYVEKNLSSPAALRDLAAAWAQMLSDLRQAKIAHGDLQHGNVLVVQGKLRLVDYDGMYVPALEGSRGIELGHRNYQHPQRTELDFGAYLDNFSAWLIYASLMAVAAQPALWGQLKGGDECLLFRKQDFDAPERSAAFRALKALPDAQVRALADRIEYFLWLPPDQVPAISEQEIAARPVASGVASPSSAQGWIQDYIKQFSVEAANEFPVIEAGDQSWLQDHVELKADIGSFSNKVSTDRYIALGALLTAWTLCAWFSLFHAALLASVIWATGTAAASLATVAIWRLRYRAEPVYRTITALRSDLSTETKARGDANGAFEELKSKRLRRRATFTEDGSRLQKREEGLQADEAKRLREIDASLQNGLQQITNRMRTAATDEGAEKRKLAESLGGEVSRLSRALTGLPDQERQEMARLDADIGAMVASFASQLQQVTARRDGELRTALKEYQDQIVNGHLQRIRLSDASIPGIGPQLKQRLAVAGFVSAGDIGTRYSNVPGIGQKKWAALHAWRQQLDGPIRAREAPKSLPTHKSAAIEQRHEAQLRQLQQSLTQEQSRLAAAQQNVKTRILDQKRTLEQQKTAAENSLRQQTASIEKKYSDQRKQIVNDEQSLRFRHRQSTEDCRTQFRAAAGQLAQEGDQIKKDYRANLDQMNAEIETAAKLVRDISWRRNQAERKYLAYGALSFRNYTLRVFRRS
ncbi:MAG TPA: hypothetical protein VMH80_03920 [Bryobacteraceae bacterium]|nr:hypothetical protein [Bryobacteraceae bacterium]